MSNVYWWCRYNNGVYLAEDSMVQKPCVDWNLEVTPSGTVAAAHVYCQGKPTYNEFRAMFHDLSGYWLPEKEQPRRWQWSTDTGWDALPPGEWTFPIYLRYSDGTERIRVYGTTLDRDRHRDALRTAADAVSGENADDV